MASDCEMKPNNEKQFADLGGIRQQQWCEGGRRMWLAELFLRARRTTIVSLGGRGDHFSGLGGHGDCIGLNNCLGDNCGT